MTKTNCYQCAQPVPLAGNAYRCPVCGFAATIRTMDFREALEAGLRLGAVQWVEDQPHTMEID